MPARIHQGRRDTEASNECVEAGPDIAVLLTCHNRSAKTLKALHALFNQNPPLEGVRVYLVDDGCTDDTRRLVNTTFPAVRILSGDGTLYWGGGMALAFTTALQARHDFYLWLNDDTELFPDALARLFGVHAALLRNRGTDAVVVGATCEPGTARTSYGGIRRISWLPWGYEMARPGLHPVRCSSFHGNCVLIPRRVAESVGSVDAAFRHFMGDVDYGFRATREGHEIWLAPHYAGACARDPAPDRPVPSLRRALTELRHPKGLRFADATLVSFREWWRFATRHGGAFWLLYFLWPYRRLLRCLRAAQRSSS